MLRIEESIDELIGTLIDVFGERMVYRKYQNLPQLIIC